MGRPVLGDHLRAELPAPGSRLRRRRGHRTSSTFSAIKNAPPTPRSVEDQRIAALKATLAQNPKDVTTLLALATVYQQNDQLRLGGHLPGAGHRGRSHPEGRLPPSGQHLHEPRPVQLHSGGGRSQQGQSVDPRESRCLPASSASLRTAWATPRRPSWPGRSTWPSLPTATGRGSIREQVDKLSKLATTTTTTAAVDQHDRRVDHQSTAVSTTTTDDAVGAVRGKKVSA